MTSEIHLLNDKFWFTPMTGYVRSILAFILLERLLLAVCVSWLP